MFSMPSYAVTRQIAVQLFVDGPAARYGILINTILVWYFQISINVI